jgi:hypothetical protein
MPFLVLLQINEINRDGTLNDLVYRFNRVCRINAVQKDIKILR